MTGTLSPSYMQAFSRKADENLATAEDAFHAGRSNAAASRLYYAVYQALVAILHQHNGFRAPANRSHTIVLNKAQTLLMYDGSPVDRALLQRVANMRNQRVKADYKPTDVDQRMVERLLETAKEGISAIRNALDDAPGIGQ
jgi:uncharacterized protein (UPF0332 family)